MAEIPQAVTAENRAGVEEWAVQSRMLLIADEPTRYATERAADMIAALGHAGAGRAVTDAAYVVAQLAGALTRATGQELSGDDALALLGMAGLVLADREADCG